jgi:hypothetical protein
MARIIWFFIWRAWFAGACNLTGWVFKLGAPGWAVNLTGYVTGTRYAWRMARLTGWSGEV